MLLSLVIPVFNEEETLPLLLRTLCPIAEQVDSDYELILVDDGSRDRTFPIMQEAAATNRHLKVLSFSRNFGHQLAVTAGLDVASGDCVVVMDADLQDPPELLPQMVALYLEGYDIVSPQRASRQGDSFFKKFTAKAFYQVMKMMVDRRLVPEVGDFRLFSQEALQGIRSFREQHRFMRGLVAWLGLKEAILPFHRQARAAGETKYPLWKMLRFSWVAITSFSGLPLRLALVVGMGLVVADAVLLVWVLYAALIKRAVVPGWASLVMVQGVFSGFTLIAVGLLGDYVGRIYDETKGRPLYVVGRTENLNLDALQVPRAVLIRRRK